MIALGVVGLPAGKLYIISTVIIGFIIRVAANVITGNKYCRA
jgi:hypothetical protein